MLSCSEVPLTIGGFLRARLSAAAMLFGARLANAATPAHTRHSERSVARRPAVHYCCIRQTHARGHVERLLVASVVIKRVSGHIVGQSEGSREGS
jgi:hypothetical protein